MDKPDDIAIQLPPSYECCGCQFSVDDAHAVIQSRQVFDRPEAKLEVTEQPLAQIECYGHVQSGSYPPEVTANIQYAPVVWALAIKQSVDHTMPLEPMSHFFEDVSGYDLNSATIEEALERADTCAEPLEAPIMTQLAEVESSISMQLAYAWQASGTGCTGRPIANLTHLFVDEKRDAVALNAEISVLNQFTGPAVHDG